MRQRRFTRLRLTDSFSNKLTLSRRSRSTSHTTIWSAFYLNCDKTNRIEMKRDVGVLSDFPEPDCPLAPRLGAYHGPALLDHRCGGLYRFTCAAAAFQDPYYRSGLVTAILSGWMSLHPVTS